MPDPLPGQPERPMDYATLERIVRENHAKLAAEGAEYLREMRDGCWAAAPAAEIPEQTRAGVRGRAVEGDVAP